MTTTTTRTTTKSNRSEYARALDLLTRYLALRDHSRLELERKLSRRFEADLVARVLEEADAHGWIGEPEDIAARAASALQRRMKSRRYVEGQLRKRGLPLPPRDDEKELANARALIERKFGAPTDLSFEERARAFRFLKYRGFEDRLIRMVFHAES